MTELHRKFLASTLFWRHRAGLFALAAMVVLSFLLPSQPAHAAANQETFASPEEALPAVIKACEHDDTAALLRLFGPEGKDIVESGDRRQDKEGRDEFVEVARQKNTLIQDPMNPDRMIISIGEEDWPFPVPLVRQQGRWHFDSAQGRQEILARRIGANEMDAIEICRGYVVAQFEYAQDHRHRGVPEYAQKIVSSPGKQDGLYWESGNGAPECHIPKGFAKAAAGMAAAVREPYHGYYFKVLKAQGPDARGRAVNYVVNGSMIGGFALVAWPAQYGVSGIQTFIINHDDNVYEKALGPNSAKIVEQMTQFNPDKSWRAVQSE